THASLVTRVYFPRELLPLRYVASSLFDLTVASSVLVLMLAYYHVSLTAPALWVAPALLLLAAIALTGSLVLCAVHVRFRDVGVAMPLLLQVWMFASPVIYPLSAVPAGWRKFYVLNPMVGVVDTFRRAVITGTAPDPAAFGTAIAVAAVALPLAYVWFKQTAATMADSVGGAGDRPVLPRSLQTVSIPGTRRFPGILGVARSHVRRAARRSTRRHRPQRRRQEHAAEAARVDHRADRGRNCHLGTPVSAHRARLRLPSRAHRTGERIPERRHTRHDAPGNLGQVRSHRSIRRRHPFHRRS